MRVGNSRTPLFSLHGKQEEQKTPLAPWIANQEHPYMLTILFIFHLKKLEYQMGFLDAFLMAGNYFCEIKNKIMVLPKM